jgi:hypothetical protein
LQQIEERFTTMSESPARAPEYEEVRSSLKVWVCPQGDAAAAPDDSLVSRAMAAGVKAVLVIDRPDSIVSVTPEVVVKWGKSADELFDLALANVREQDRPAANVVKGSEIRVLTGESPFVTAWALMLDRLFDPMPQHGGLVAMPQSRVLFFLPIVDVSVAPAIGPLFALSDGLFKKGPDSLSPNLYWWHDGSLTHLPGGVSERGVEFTPPDEFLDVLQSLAAEVE